jgi:protein-S-isoprenylcysteine O-methyltransferase Ste14
MSGMLLCKYLWLVLLAVWAVGMLRAKRTQTRESLASRLSYSVLVVAGFYAELSTDVPVPWLRLNLFAASPWTDVPGVALTAAGVGFAIWARLYLGGNWSGAITVKVGHNLIRTGPYRWVRHPIYTGFLLALLGTAIELRQVRGFVGFKIKSRIEERTMAGAFGPDYDDYNRSTGAILPRLL